MWLLHPLSLSKNKSEVNFGLRPVKQARNVPTLNHRPETNSRSFTRLIMRGLLQTKLQTKFLILSHWAGRVPDVRKRMKTSIHSSGWDEIRISEPFFLSGRTI